MYKRQSQAYLPQKQLPVNGIIDRVAVDLDELREQLIAVLKGEEWDEMCRNLSLIHILLKTGCTCCNNGAAMSNSRKIRRRRDVLLERMRYAEVGRGLSLIHI